MNTQEMSKTELSARVPTRGRRMLFLAATFLSLLLILLVGLYLSIPQSVEEGIAVETTGEDAWNGTSLQAVSPTPQPEGYNVKEEEKEHKIENKKKNKAKTNKNIPKSPSIKKEVNKFSDINSEINESIYGCEDIKKIKIKEESVANTDEYSLISEINSEIKSFDLKSPNSYGINDENDSDSEKSKLTATFFSNTNTTDKHEN